jgi:IS30 family transposase
MTISKELARGVHRVTGSVSHECIYTAVYAHGGRGLPAGLHKGLHRQQRCRKHRRTATVAPASLGPLGVFNPITERPPVAEARTEVGHLEGDLIVGSFNRSALVTVFDRASRYLWLADLPKATAPTLSWPPSTRSPIGSPSRCAAFSPGTKVGRWPATLSWPR